VGPGVRRDDGGVGRGSTLIDVWVECVIAFTIRVMGQAFRTDAVRRPEVSPTTRLEKHDVP